MVVIATTFGSHCDLSLSQQTPVYIHSIDEVITFLCFLFLCSMDYNQKSKFITDRLSVLKTEMDDLKMEERLTRNDKIHEMNFRQGRDSKKIMVDQVTVT